MRVTLIYAGITAAGFSSLPTEESTWISHGLALLSAVLKQNNYEVTFMDLRRLKGWDDFAEKIKRNNAEIYGLTMMSCDFDPVMKCCEIIKRESPGIPIVVGGPHPSIMPEELLDSPLVDYVFVGEGEVSLVGLLRNIDQGRPTKKLIKGVPPDLDSLPFADRSLFPTLEEPYVPFLEPPFVTIIAGRGCRYHCRYCMPAERFIFGNSVRRRSVANVIQELIELREKYDFRSMMIHDDCLTEDRNWVLDFCQAYRDSGFFQPWVCQSRPDLICRNPEMVDAMKKAGLCLLIIGMESGSDRVLRLLKRGCKVEHNLKAAEVCHKMGIKVSANYMLGLPTETKEEQRATVEMIKKIKPYRCSPAFYTSTPGSDLFDFCIQNNLSLITDHRDYRRGLYTAKIRGIDYGYLNKLRYESLGFAEEYRSGPWRVMRWLPAPARNLVRVLTPEWVKRPMRKAMCKALKVTLP